MAGFRHILVPTDGTALSTRAMKAAVGIARAHRASITALHVIPPYFVPLYVDGFAPDPALYSPDDYKRRSESQARRLLERAAKQAQAADVRCDRTIATGEFPWKLILRTAKAHRCDLIVMASHGRRGLEGFLLGSETQKVLTHSRLPVLVVR